jgi:hypothetical protein
MGADMDEMPPPPVFYESFRYRASNRGWAVLAGAAFIVGLLVYPLSVIASVTIMIDAAGTFLFVLLLQRYYVVDLFSDGIRSFDGIGIYHNIPWERMRSAYRLPLGPGLVYIGVRTGEGFAILVPAFLIEREDFRRNLLRLAPEGNPLRAAFEKMA